MSDKQITIKEFKMWLQGVEEMQEDGWTPDAKQWARIRSKIQAIDETEHTSTPVSYNRPQYASVPAVGYDVAPPQVAPQFDIPPNVAAQPLTSGVFSVPGGAPARLPSDMTGNGTPGQYSTPFA